MELIPIVNNYNLVWYWYNHYSLDPKINSFKYSNYWLSSLFSLQIDEDS